jgi:hypothetical protein
MASNSDRNLTSCFVSASDCFFVIIASVIARDHFENFEKADTFLRSVSCISSMNSFCCGSLFIALDHPLVSLLRHLL